MTGRGTGSVLGQTTVVGGRAIISLVLGSVPDVVDRGAGLPTVLAVDGGLSSSHVRESLARAM